MEPIETVDRALITAIQEQVLTPELQGSIVDEVVARIRSIPAVTERFREKERESVALERTLAGVRSVAKVESIDFRALDRVPSGAFGNLEATIRSDDVRACAVLSSLLSGRVLFHPTETEVGGKPRRAHRIEASLVIGRLLVSSDDQQCRAFTSPTGFAHPAPASFPEVRVVVPAVKAA